MKKLTVEQMLALDNAFPGCIYETVLEDDLKQLFIYLRPEMTEKYRRIFECCALNIKEVGKDDVTYHKFDIVIKGLGNSTLIIIPEYSFGSVTRNLTSYWKSQNLKITREQFDSFFVEYSTHQSEFKWLRFGQAFFGKFGEQLQGISDPEVFYCEDSTKAYEIITERYVE